MADTSITRRLSFGSRTFPIDKYLSGIDDSELLGLHYVETQHSLPFTSQADLTSQEEQFTSLKYNYMQNNVMLKMHENIDTDFDTVEPDDKLKRAKQVAKESKKEQQKVDQEIRQVIAQIAQLQQQYQEMQFHLRNSLAPLNQSLEVSQDGQDKDKDTKASPIQLKHKTIETQTDDCEDMQECRDSDDVEPALMRGAARMAYQRNLTKQISGQDQVERTSTQATIQMGRDALSFEIEEGQVQLSGAYCDATFMHGDILDYAAQTKDFPLLCYDLQARLKCRDAIAADVSQIQGATWDESWQVNVAFPNGHTATLVVDPNYGTEFGKVKVAKWSALESNAALQKTVDTIHGPVPYDLPQVARLLASAL